MKSKKTSFYISIFSVFILCIIAGIGGFLSYKKYKTSLTENQLLHEIQALEGGESHTGATVEKTSTSTGSFSKEGLILDGDAYMNSEQYAFALKRYLDAYDENLGDTILAEKIGDAYFGMTKFLSAKKYYELGNTKEKKIQKKIILSHLYSLKLDENQTISDLNTTIDTLQLLPEESFFYKTTFSCVFLDFHLCKKTFGEYLDQKDVVVEMQSLKELQQTLLNYKNFKTDDLLYKDALITGTFFTLELYPVAIKLAKDLLVLKPNYTPAIQILAESYFQLGDYENAKKYLDMYIQIQPNDAKSQYLMGVIQSHLREYLLSNIFLQKSIDLGYTPTITAKRRIVFNFSLLGQTESLLLGLEELIRFEKDYDQNDTYLALYYHIIHQKYDIGLELAKLGEIKFPKDGNIVAFKAWIYMLKNEIEKASIEAKKGVELDPRSPLTNYQISQIHILNKDYLKAFIYLKRTVREDPLGEFGKKATVDLEKIGAHFE